MRTDNNSQHAVLQQVLTFKQNRSKSIDMRFYWLRDRADQGQFRIYWKHGDTNLADYLAKFHPASHHRRARPIYLKTINSPSSLQGCIELLRGRTRPQMYPQVQLEVKHAATA